MHPNVRSTKLAAALRDRQPVKYVRPYEEGSVNGYVMAIGARWFMLAVLDGSIRFDGFQCSRLADVRNLQVPHPQAAFVEAALKKRGERLPRKPRVSVESIEELLLSANRAFPLVTIHREKVAPDVCMIGRVLGVKDGRVSLLETTPEATWAAKPNHYRLADITRIDFGGGYEGALHLVGGPPPAG